MPPDSSIFGLGVMEVITCTAILARRPRILSEAALVVQAIAIDEAQFFPDLLQFCLEAAEQDNKLVMVAGLDGDFRRRRFGQV